MSEDNYKWWNMVPEGATLQNKDTMDGVAAFAQGDERWLVDLFDDTAVACTQETIDELGYFVPQPTVIIHDVIADNDVLSDNGWEGVGVVVALNHDTWKIEGVDTSTEALTARLVAEGFRVLHEDNEFAFVNGRWTREGA